ncbi:hypothetical protein THRCLA_04110 [Thraustotheca clavata]|uniref:Cytosolic endo-beta-N-acetylglucosaminidase TIM barrel domain-containing protein n=1 Tax=Thraustotheca clavata TaxID=74557 RepID=A0A1V9ZZY5_9STRA|nr:hypothetical protein THRCLA_04110 [Thraustotheca clavata]
MDEGSNVGWIGAVIVSIGLGIVSLLWFIASKRPKPVIESSRVQHTKYQVFVEGQIAAVRCVLFTTTTDSIIFSLFERGQVDFVHVNLEKIAGKAKIEEVLCAYDEFKKATEYLFIDGTFQGSSKALNLMYQNGELSKLVNTSLPTPVDQQKAILTISLAQSRDVKQHLTMDEINSLSLNNLPKSKTPLATRLKTQSFSTRSQLLVHFDEEIVNYPWDVMDYLVFPSEPTALITLPKSGWVDAAHRNGVTVLGAVHWPISTQMSIAHATQLCNIVEACGFDGWVVHNIIPSKELFQLLSRYNIILACSNLSEHQFPGVSGILYTGDWDTNIQNKLKEDAQESPLFVHLNEHSDLQARTLRFGGASVSIPAKACQAIFWATTWRSLGSVHMQPNKIATSFDCGYGDHYSIQGQVVSSNAWKDPSCMDLQPKSIATRVKGQLTASLTQSVSYHGGSSLYIQGMIDPKQSVMLDILAIDITFPPHTPLLVQYSFMNTTPNVAFNIVLWASGRREHLVLRAKQHDNSSPKKKYSSLVGRSAHGSIYASSTERINEGWTTRTFTLGGQVWETKSLVSIAVSAVNLHDTPEALSAHLGHLTISPQSNIASSKPLIESVEWLDEHIKWCTNDQVASMCIYKEKDGKPKFVHHTRNTTWIPLTPGRYLLRPMDLNGAFLCSLEQCPRVEVSC